MNISEIKMSKRNVRYLVAIILALIGFVQILLEKPGTQPMVSADAQATSTTAVSSTNIGASPTTSTVQTNALVVHVADGDTVTVKIDGEKDEAKIRLLGVNTAESVDPRRPVECFGKEASNFTKSMLDGKRIRLEADPQADERDKYGRLLRNIILEDGTDFNAKLVRDGWAYAYVSFPQNKQRKAELLRLQKEAEAAKRGLWDPETCNGIK